LHNPPAVLYKILFAEKTFMECEVAKIFLYQSKSHPCEGFSINSFVSGYTGLLALGVHRYPPPREQVHRSKSI